MTVDQENPNSQPLPEDELPDWLKQIRGEAPAASPKPAPPSTDLPEETVADIEELPPWLQDVPAEPYEPEEIESDAPESVSAAEPEPAMKDASEPVAAQAADDGGKELWEQILADEGVSLDNVPEERPMGAEDMSVKDWMQSTADESAKRLAAAETARPTSEPEPAEAATDERVVAQPAEPTAETADDGMVVEAELPDWLKEEILPETEAETPSWLSDESIIAAASDIPGVPAEPIEAAIAEESDQTLPDWLKEDASPESEETEAKTPAWLGDESVVDTEKSVAKPEMATVADETVAEEEELPDWLKDDVASEADSELPSWLTDESVVAETIEDTVPMAAGGEPETEATEDKMVVEEELPDWLREDVSAETDATAETPAWLTDESFVEEAAAEVVEERTVFDDEKLPDWLQEGEEKWAEAEAEIEVPADEAKIVAEAGPVEEELPDWLTEEPDETAEPVAAVEAPAWLEEIATDEKSVEPEEVPIEAAKTVKVEAEGGVAAAVEEAVVEPEPVETMETAVEPAVATADVQPERSEAFKTALNALKVGQLNDALRKFSSMIEQRDRLDDIEETLSSYINVYADNPELFETLGDVQARLGQLNKAFQSYKTALRKL